MQNMEYKVKFTEKCLEDIEEACQYMEEKLKEENVANRFRMKIEDSVKELSISPQMYARTEKFDRVKRNYRKIPIGSYVLLYIIDEENKIVYLSHMYYAGRNYLDGLI